MKIVGYNGVEVKLSSTEASNRAMVLTRKTDPLWDMLFKMPCADCKKKQRIYYRSYCRDCEMLHQGTRK
jgi:hypothetical protein